MSDIQTWSNTAASNNASPPNGFPEGMAPSTVNDAAREVMAAISRYRSDTDGVNTSAGTNTITLAASRTMTAYAQGDLYTFKAGGTNTGATTINVDSLGAKAVQFNGAALVGGEIVSGLMYTVVYDGTQFQLLNASAIPAIDITTLEVTNIKAKDGTASATIANSTGLMTVSAGIESAKFRTTGERNLNAGGFSDNQSYNVPGIGLSAASSFSTSGITVTAGSITNQYGFYAGGVFSFTQATNNFGFFSGIDSSAGINIYQFYAGGTAPNYFKGTTTFENQVTFSGNTIVSTTDNTNAALRVTQLGTGNALEIEDSTNPDATPFVIANNGVVVQGSTTAIGAKLGTTGGLPYVQIHGTQQQTAAYSTYGYSSSVALAGFFLFNRSKSGTIGTLSAVADGDILGTIQWSGSDNDASPTFNPAAYIQASCAGTVGTTSIPGRLTFWTTAASGTSPTQRISIEPTGYVGIGATPNSAAQLLDLRGTNNGLTNDAPVNTLRFTDTDTTTAANQPIGKIEFYNSDTGNAAVGAYILASAVGASGGGTLRFAAAADAGAAAEIARVSSTGLTVTAKETGLGYGAGTGGAVTQATSRTTGVTLNSTNGAITLVSAAGTATWQSFTVTNSTVAATDVVILSQKSGTDLYMLEVTAVAAGSFRISFATTGGTTTEQPVFNFAVIKAVAA